MESVEFSYAESLPLPEQVKEPAQAKLPPKLGPINSTIQKANKAIQRNDFEFHAKTVAEVSLGRAKALSICKMGVAKVLSVSACDGGMYVPDVPSYCRAGWAVVLGCFVRAGHAGVDLGDREAGAEGLHRELCGRVGLLGQQDPRAGPFSMFQFRSGPAMHI